MAKGLATERHIPQGLGLYLREIQRSRLLTAEEERDLAERVARGDEAARDRMIQANLRLVIKIAGDYLGRGLPLEDLIGEGNLGLIRATREYDPRFGTRFSTYASYWVKQAIHHALVNTASTIRLPAHMVNLLTRWKRAERRLARTLGKPPGFDEVAEDLGLAASQRRMILQAMRAGTLCREGVGEDGESTSWLPDEAADPGAAPEEPVALRDEIHELRRRLLRLDDRERMILALRYGLGGVPPQTLKQVAASLDVTREWIRKIELRALAKLGREMGSVDGETGVATGAASDSGEGDGDLEPEGGDEPTRGNTRGLEGGERDSGGWSR